MAIPISADEEVQKSDHRGAWARGEGHGFIGAGLRAGATAIVVQADRQAKWSGFRDKAPLIVVPNTRAVLGVLAASVYGKPSARLMTIGVTGTDGKTTTSHLI